MMSAIGNFAAVVTALVLALGSAVAARREAHRRALAALATVDDVIIAAMEFSELLHHDVEDGSIRGTAIARHLTFGRVQELRAMIAEIRPTDMPTTEVAKAWSQVRTMVRSLDGILTEAAKSPANYIRFDGEDWMHSFGRVRLRMEAEAEYFERRLRVLPRLPDALKLPSRWTKSKHHDAPFD